MDKMILIIGVINIVVLILFSLNGPSSLNTYEVLESARLARDDYSYKKQRVLLSQVLKERSKVLGSEHPGIAKLYSRMAHSFLNSNNLEPSSEDVLDNFDKAEEFADKAIVIARKQAEQNNWQLGLYVAQKGNIILERAVRNAKNVPDRAIMLLEQGLGILENGLGANSPEFQITKTILARALRMKGECNRSAELFMETLNWFVDNLPAESERLALQYVSVAKAQVCAGRYDEAIKSNQLALTIYPDINAYQESRGILNYKNGILYFILGSDKNAFSSFETAHELLINSPSSTVLKVLKQDLEYLEAFTKSEISDENLLIYRSILRKRRLENQMHGPKAQIFDPKVIVALEELIIRGIESIRVNINGE